MNTPSKDEVAERLAQGHYAVDSGILKIIRLVDSPEREADPAEPIKLLEVYEHAFPSGIIPVHFPPHPASGLAYPAEIVQIAPEEFEQLRNAQLRLPDGWAFGHEYPRDERHGDPLP